MGFNDEYLKLRRKRQEEDEEEKSSVPYQRPLNNSVRRRKSSRDRVISDDIAPVKEEKEEEKERKWFDKGAFEDGYQFGDVSKTILGSIVDVGKNVGAGVIGLGEKVVDALVTVSPYIAQGQYYQNGGGYNLEQDKLFKAQNDQAKKEAEEFVKKDLYNEEDVAHKIISAPVKNLTGIDSEDDSVFGAKSDALAQSGGQLLGTVGLQAVGVPWWLTTGVSTFGSETEGALNSGATMEEAALSGFVSAGAEILTEKISGGISFGGKTLDDALTKQLAVGISNKTVRTLAKIGVDMAGEGGEEILSGVMSAIGQKLTYANDKELNELFSSEEAFESFIGGAVLGGVSSGANAVKGAVNGVDTVTELTKDEQAVFDKVYKAELEAEAKEKGDKLTSKEKSKIYDKVMNDFEKGYISTDTIEEVLGGEDYTNYQNELKRQQDIDNELNTLRNMKSGEMTDIQMERMAELKGMKPNTELVNSLKFGIDEKIRNSIQNSRLLESYNEKTRRTQAFEADLSQYDSKQAEVIKKAIESGILNNTNRTHDFVDMVAKISADKGVLFDFANNAKLKESGFAVDGKFVNGYVTKDGITVNIDSNKALNSIVGHEITHVLEGTEFYNELQNTIIEYAKSKGEYQSRIDTLTKLYEGVKDADVNAELTADLVGDYLFTDSDFINHLSTTNRNVFQKIYDEIKYLYKVATAGSKQARELEKVKRAFDKAYRESGKAEGTKYSLSDSDGNKLTQEQAEFFKDSIESLGYDGIIDPTVPGKWNMDIEEGTTHYIVFKPNQIKSITNENPTDNPDIRYSLSEYTAEEKKAHNKAVLDHFGKTYSWNETGYLLLDGTRLDLSGKHDGAPGGYRTVDHRDITEALGYDYGGGDYSGSLIQFMSEGNIRIIPESNGINLSVKPTKAQEQALADFISRYRGEMMLDIDDLNGNTVVSVEYPKGTYYTKILNDIREWFENGKKPEVASRYPFFSLSDTNEAPKKTYGSYNVYGKDIRLPGADLGPVGVAENATTTEETDYLPEDYAPIENSYTIEQELDEIQTQIDALVEEGTALYNKGEEAKAMELLERINELSEKARALTERANTLKAQEEAEQKAYMDSLTDADVPLEAERAYSEAETTPLDDKTLKKLTKGVRDILSCMPKENKSIREVIENYSTSNQTKSQLFKELREKFGDKYEYRRYSDIAEVKKHLRNTKFAISDHVKGDIADFGDYKKLHGIRNSKNALSVDVVYEELSGLFPGVFSPGITNETDRLERIAEVMDMPAREWVKVAELSDNEIMQAVDFIHNEVVGYRNNAVRKAAEANARAYIDDIAPSRAKEITENVSDPTLNYQGIHRETQIKTVKERIAEKLSNVEKELADNKRLRADSVVDFNREIARLQEEYNAKENKNTKVANNILRRIESLQRMKNNVDADYEKRISDLEAKKAKLSQEARTGTSATEQSIMRAELHLSKIDDIRAKFAEKGLNFDETLKNAKNLSTFATVDNTPQRVMEKSLGYREGQILADETVNKVAQNETEGIKWLNSYTDRKNGLIAQISRQYNIKPGTKESAAAQMYAEGFYVNKNNEIIKYGDNELAMDFPDAKVQANIKGLARDTRIRQIYDETLDMINESRARNAYPEIQKLDNYFLHFRAMDDTFSRLGLPFNPNDIRAKDLPTDLNGVTADLKPGQPYFASAKHREGIKTSYDLLGGLERYLSSAKNQIYHIDDIQTLRALRNHIADTYGQAKGLEDLDSLSEAEAQERIKEVFDGHLSTFAKFLHEEANVIAGKTALIDRGLEGVIGRRGMTFMNELNRQVGANMVGFNVSSSLTNFLAPVQAFAKTNKAAFVKGFAQTVSNKLGSITGKTDGFAENSPVMIRRKGAERFYRTPFQKVGDAGYVLMSAVDNISTEIIARAKYNELTAKGMSADQAHVETDKWVSRLMGDRSLGQMPQLYNSKTLGIITKFQLEVRNQLDSQFYDTIQETKANNADIENTLERNSKTAAKVALVFTELAIVQHLFGKAFEEIAGYNPAFDIIDVLIKTLGFDDEEESEDTALDNIEQGFLALLEDLPYTSTFTGGRIPISSALPITELIKGEDEYGNEKSRLETLGEIAPYYVLPGGYGQLKKTAQGLSMFSDEHPIAGSYTDSGNLRFPVDETPLNVAQAAIFGQWASDNARDYFDNERAPLNEKQTQEFIDVGMTIQDYWKYREGLSQYKTLAEKADYIYGLDLTVEQKNVLINNIADRKEDIDMSDYGNYGSFEEFDYANKYPEKYEFWKQNGISYEDYASGDDDTKAAYNWAFENPEKFTLSKAVADNVVTYRQYTKELNDLKADKDEDGKSIVGSRKEKVIDYVNNLDADYGAKIILFKSEYPADDTYNYDIIDYLNNRDDISYEQMKTILIELGFTVDSKGNITWD